MPSALPEFQQALYTLLSTNVTGATTYDFLPTTATRPWVAMIGESDEVIHADKGGKVHAVSGTLRVESDAYGGSEVRTLSNAVLTAFDTAITTATFTVRDTPAVTVSRFADISEQGGTLFIAVIEARYILEE